MVSLSIIGGVRLIEYFKIKNLRRKVENIFEDVTSFFGSLFKRKTGV
jgi:hypothetical protein